MDDLIDVMKLFRYLLKRRDEERAVKNSRVGRNTCAIAEGREAAFHEIIGEMNAMYRRKLGRLGSLYDPIIEEVSK